MLGRLSSCQIYRADEASFEKASKLDSNNARAIMFLANVHIYRGPADAAIADYQGALQAKPRDLRTLDWASRVRKSG